MTGKAHTTWRKTDTGECSLDITAATYPKCGEALAVRGTSSVYLSILPVLGEYAERWNSILFWYSLFLLLSIHNIFPISIFLIFVFIFILLSTFSYFHIFWYEFFLFCFVFKLINISQKIVLSSDIRVPFSFYIYLCLFFIHLYILYYLFISILLSYLPHIL